MSKVTIVLPISRDTFLDRVFSSLELLNCDASQTSLFCYVDGDAALYLTVRNFCEQSKFTQRLTVQRKSKDGPVKTFDLKRRRTRIANIHNEIRRHLRPCDYIFCVEDDTIVPTSALTKLLKDYARFPFAGLISGVALGRHGIPHLGLWKTDDPYEPKRLESVMPGEGVQEVDASGMYCALTKYNNYAKHEFKVFGDNTLGPDIDWGISTRQVGYTNYADHSIQCEHRTREGNITLANTKPMKVTFELGDKGWKQTVTR